jgi:hypothetical protein
MGVLGTRNIDMSATYSKGNPVMSSANVVIIVAVPVVLDDYSIYELLDKALEKEGYEFATDVEIKTSVFFTYLVDWIGYEVHATGWKKDTSSVSMENSENIIGYKVEKSDGEFEIAKLPTDKTEELRTQFPN